MEQLVGPDLTIQNGAFAPGLKANHWKLSNPSPFRSTVLWDGGRPIGAVRVYNITLRGPAVSIACWGLGCVWIEPDFRGRGLGVQLVRKSVKELSGLRVDWKHPRIGLLLFSQDRTLYKDCGFSPIKECGRESLWFRSMQPGLSLSKSSEWNTPGVEHF